MSWFHGATQRLRAVLRWRRVEADLEEEFRDHLEREVERQLAAGVSPAEARRKAKLRFGEPDVVKESVRDEHGWRFIEDAVTDVRIGLRGLSKNASFTVAALLSLGLGVGGTVAIYSAVHAVLVAPLPYPESGRLHEVRIWWNDFDASLSMADLLVLQQRSTGIAEVAGYCRCTASNSFGGRDGFSLQTVDGPELVQGVIVTPDLPRVLRVSPLLGPGFSEEPDAVEVLIGETLWRERFGGIPDVIGHTIELDEETVTIVGVMPDGFNVPGQKDGQVWWKDRLEEPTRRGPFFINAVARLTAGVGAPQAAERLTANVAPELRARFGVDDGSQRRDLSRSAEWRYGLRPMKDVLVGDVRPTLLLTFGAAALVLLIAIMNVTNLLLARGTVRVRELAVRAAVGAGRGRLVRQLLAESALLGMIGGVIGLAVAIVLLRVAGDAALQIVPRMEEVRLSGLMVTLALAAGCVAGIAAGTFPALRLPGTSWIGCVTPGGSRRAPVAGKDARGARSSSRRWRSL